MRWVLRVSLAVSATVFLGLSYTSYRQAVDQARYASYGRDLRQLKVLDSRVNEAVLKARSGVVLHYDDIVSNMRSLGELLHKLEDVPRFLGPEASNDLQRQLAAMVPLFTSKDDLIEAFKTHNAVLRNSQRLLPIAAQALLQDPTTNSQLGRHVSLVLGALFPQDSSPERELEAEFAPTLAGLDDVSDPAGAVRLAAVDTFQRHARVVREIKSVVNGIVLQALGVPLRNYTSALEDAYLRHAQAALDAAGLRQRLLFAVAMLIVRLGLTDVIVGTRRAATALERVTTDLLQANEALAREREKEREVGEMKARFAAMISHEFRTPLSAILSSGELLSRYGERWDAERRQEHQRRIQEAAHNMGQMLEEILLIGRGEAGMLQPMLAPVNLKELCMDVTASLTIATAHPPHILPTFRGDLNVISDERMLRYLLSNLLENAIKYSPPEMAIDVEIQTELDWIRVLVRDRGIGIDPADLPALFTGFRRGSNVGQIQGSGLGLAVVKHVADALEGTIQVRSELGLGSEFVASIPQARTRPGSNSLEVS